MKILGKTKLLGVIGYPIEHSLSPLMQNAAIKDLKVDYVYLPLEVAPENLKDAIHGLKSFGFVGVNITIPHKQSVINFMNELSEEADMIGAVNTIHIKDGKYYGYNTDAYGFLTSLKEEAQVDLAGKKITIIGAGGVSRAISAACVFSGAKRLVIMDVVIEKAIELCSTLSKFKKGCEIINVMPGENKLEYLIANSDILINSTPLGMHKNDPLPVRTEYIASGTFVFDVIYNVGNTPLLKEARKNGCKVLNGLSMLAHQGARSFEIWTGIKPNVYKMKKTLEKYVGKNK